MDANASTAGGRFNPPRESWAPSGRVEIAYEEIGSPEGRPIVLVPGLGTQMIYWDRDLCEMLVERGFRVIRMENRDAGRSTVLDWAGIPDRTSVLMRRRRGLVYSMDDMADDLIALLDHLGIERAHLAGFSMGGMVVQTAAIRHPGRVLSICSIMSSTGAWRDSFPGPREGMALLRERPTDREQFIEFVEDLARVLGSPAFPPDPERLRTLGSLAWDRGIHPTGTLRQLHAVNTQPDRRKALRSVEVPALVMHGIQDRLVWPAAGVRTADSIPGARLRLYEGMAHDLPEPLWPRFATEIEANADRAR